MRAFGPDHRHLTLADVARRTGLSRAATRRFLLTLVELGYVHDAGRSFSLRPRVLELGYAYLSTLGLEEVAAPHLERLVASIRESSSIAVLDGDDIVYVLRVPTRRIMAVAISVGTRFPAYATSMGRVLLASIPAPQLDTYLDRVRLDALTVRTVTDPQRLRRTLGVVAARGWAIVDQELEDGLRSVAAPITDRTGTVVAAVNTSVHASRTTLDTLRRTILPQLQTTAAAITADLRSVPPVAHPPGPSPGRG
ncbi:MAG: helix-turn-helix domain-containing protein [Actinomycetota bacterium]|nr:helix-turn-helix domain-containing protein [Actinomycetota bacterium]